MVSIKATVIGRSEMEENTKEILRRFSHPETARIMLPGAEAIAMQVRKNIVKQGLVDTGELLGSVRAYMVNQFASGVIVDKVYAAVHEYGLQNWVITPKQRSFFWAMWYQEGDSLWKALALSETYTIPARPYFRPAIDEAKGEARKAIVKEINSRLEL